MIGLNCSFLTLYREESAYTIRLGEYNLEVSEGTEQDIPAKLVIRHPDFFSPSILNNDSGLIQLERAATPNERVRTVCLPAQNESVPTSAKCFITGVLIGCF